MSRDGRAFLVSHSHTLPHSRALEFLRAWHVRNEGTRHAGMQICERERAMHKIGVLIHVPLDHRLISRDRPTKTGRLWLCSPFFYVAALNVRI